MNRTQDYWPDGYAVAAIRQTCLADRVALSDFFEGLSVQTRYLRFFAPVTPGPALLRVLSGSAERTDAVVAVRDGIIIGHAMATDATDPQNPEDHQNPAGGRTTEIGVVVADAWQGRGVGSALVRAVVARAQARGVTSVAMDVLPGNRRVLAMITGHWPEARIGRSPDSITVSILLSDHHRQRHQTRPAAVRPAAASPAANRRAANHRAANHPAATARLRPPARRPTATGSHTSAA